jgi:NAD(P)-dependent dehydrogenase (short-subunit alcohol dehydrogenase family)
VRCGAIGFESGKQMIDFTNQVAIVTGAGRGLGRLYALDLAARGASVVVNDLGGSSTGTGANASVAGEVVAEIKAAGGKAVASTDSVGTAAGGQAIVDAALDQFGRVDIVVNNAGIIEFLPFEDISPENWRKMMNVHLDGAFYVSQPAFRAMKKQGYGRFVMVASSMGMFGGAHNLHYATAKAGIVGMTNALALEGAAHGILANSILPTGMSRMVTDRLGEGGTIPPEHKAFFDSIKPELITPLVVYLASRECQLTHHNIASFAGRYSRVFIGYGQGWLSQMGSTPSAEDVAAQIEKVTRTDAFTIPASIEAEVVEVCAQRGVKIG